MKFIYSLIFSMIAISPILEANPNFVETTGMHYDSNRNVIMPDKFYLRRALKSYQDGYNQSAYTNFKKAAAFGNSVAQKYIGLMHLKALGVPRNWSAGYALIKLAALDNSTENKALESKIQKLLNPEEVQQAQLIFEQIKNDYDQASALKRRDSWVRKQTKKIVGSRVGSQTSNVYSYSANGQLISANLSKSFDQMQSFVEDFNYGYVSSGDIVPIENDENEDGNDDSTEFK